MNKTKHNIILERDYKLQIIIIQKPIGIVGEVVYLSPK